MITPVVVSLNLDTLHGLGALPYLSPPLVRQATRAHPIQYPLADFAVVVFYLDSVGSEVAVVAEV